jgi:hypothetical protein
MLEKLPDAVGHALREQRAGLDATAYRRIDLRAGLGAIAITSLAFVDHGPLPASCTADGAGRSPPLQWTGVPDSAVSLVLLVEDADAPAPHPFVHAIAVGLPPGDGALAEGALDAEIAESAGTLVGRHSFLGKGWLPPDPPPGHGVHRYVFQMFALTAPEPEWSDTPGRDEVLRALEEQAIASGCLMGTYERPDGSVKDDETVRETAVVAPLASA